MRMGQLGLAMLVITGLAACNGRATSTYDGNSNGSTTGPGETITGPVDDPLDDVECQGRACDPVTPSASPRIVRMTHHQWENAVRDLLGLSERPLLSRTFLADPLSPSRFDRLAEYMNVTPGLWEDYREAAERLAQLVTVDDPALLAALERPGAPTDLEPRVRDFAEHFGYRAFRRPLASDEIDRYTAVMMKAEELFGEATFERAAELGLRAFLQSPHFLYRVETHLPDGATVVDLASYERASRLSFALWNTIPDDELLEAAERGDLLDEGLLRAQAQRMLDDPRATDAISDFHAQLLDYDHFAEMSKNQETFPGFNQNTPERMERELDDFIVDVAFNANGTYRDLMTAKHSFVDDDLAEIYGVDAPNGSEFGRVELGDDRPGILTRSGFLALNATPYDPNPIHRGVFVNRHVLCITLPAPPDNFSIPDGVAGNTNRERIHNATDSCGGGCHTPLINPPGFAFEQYDAMGAWRVQDNGYDIDTTGELYFDGEFKSWNSAAELIGQLADSLQAHECYARNWFEYLVGREPTDGDLALIAKAAQASHQNDIAIKQMMLSIVTSPAFMQRTTGDQ